jgi:pimeloyl-ACP methyl ester carboxylesterase
MLVDLDRVLWPAYVGTNEATTSWVEQRSIPDRLRDVRLPLLVVTGKEDQLVAPDATARYEGRPDTRVVVLDGIGHTPPVEAPSRTAELLHEAVGSG